MPKNKVSDPITDQEMAFARLVLSGTMTDRQAAEAVGLNPDSAAYTKSKPHVRAYMLEHHAAVQQQLVHKDADLSRLSRRAEELAVEANKKKHLPAHPSQNPLPARRQRRPQILSPVSPSSPIAFPSRMACRLMSPCPLLFQTPEWVSLSK